MTLLGTGIVLLFYGISESKILLLVFLGLHSCSVCVCIKSKVTWHSRLLRLTVRSFPQSSLSDYLFWFIEQVESSLCWHIKSMQVISGIEAAVKSMKVGGIRRVIIPPSQGYQNTSQEPIPPNVFTLFSSKFFLLLLLFFFFCSFVLGMDAFTCPMLEQKIAKIFFSRWILTTNMLVNCYNIHGLTKLSSPNFYASLFQKT